VKPTNIRAASPIEQTKAHALPPVDFAVADGTVEWADYGVVRDRINAAERRQLASANIVRRPIIDLGHEDLTKVADHLALRLEIGLMVDRHPRIQ
jgi:hypothetical protein